MNNKKILLFSLNLDQFLNAGHEGDEELTLTLTGKGVSETITIDDTSTEVVVAATYSLSAVDSSIEEGSEAEFLIETDPSQAGTQFKWTVTGLSAADVVGKNVRLQSSDMLGTVGKGLGLCAQRVFGR